MQSIKRYLPLALLAAILLAVLASGAWKLLSLQTLAAHEQQLHAYVAAHLALSLLAFIAVYALVTGVSLPGALVLTLTGGLLFGVWIGSIATLFGATAGAVIIYGIVHTSLGAALRERAEASGGRLKTVMDEIRAGAFGYLLGIRLVPVAPFWLVNICAALGGVPLKSYVMATFIGIIPATVIYTSIGAGIGQILARGETPKLKVVFEPFVLGPLLGLGLLSLGTTLYSRRRASR